MFLRLRDGKKGSKIQIIKSYRDDQGKPRHKLMGTLGPFPRVTNCLEIRDLAEKLLRIYDKSACILDKNISEVSRKIYGVPLVIKKLWGKFQLDRLLSSIVRKRKLKWDFKQTIFFLVASRFAWPASKLKTYNKRMKLYGEYDVKLHHIYRSLDILAENKQNIEDRIFERRRDLFNNSLDVVFFDVTTLYFESQKKREILQKGFSKDGKFSDVQIVVALLIDQRGFPIAFDLFPGNTAEVNTLADTLYTLSQRFSLNRVVLVADSAVLSASNREKLEELGYEFIIAARLRNLTEEKQQEILQLENYRTISYDPEHQEEVKLYETWYKGLRLLVTWSSKRARKDAHKRAELTQQLQTLVNSGKKSLLSSKYRKFIQLEHNSISLNIQALEHAAQWDGLWGVITNNRCLDHSTILHQYRQLWKIEETFRLMKHQFETRPIFHWTNKRILGHLVLCFLSLLLARELESQLAQIPQKLSLEHTIELLCEVQVSELLLNNRRFLLRSPIEGITNTIFRTLGVKIPSIIQEI